MKRINTNKQQKGFSILAVILVIVAVIVAIGVWALSGQTNTSSTGNSKNSIAAASIINDSSSIKLAFDTLVINGSNSNQIILMPGISSTSNKPNIADPATGIQIPKLSKGFLKEEHYVNAGQWVLMPLNNINTGAKVTLISGLNEGICKQINFQLYGVSAIAFLDSGNSPYLWKETDYIEASSQEALPISVSELTPYDGLGNIDTYNKFNNDMQVKVPNELCLDAGTSSAQGEPVYAFYRILKN